MDEALQLLHELNLHITTVHLDMGGNHRYSLTAKAHPVISRIKLYLSDHPNKPVEPTGETQPICPWCNTRHPEGEFEYCK